jgi:thioredoxin reductase (NADPH)
MSVLDLIIVGAGPSGLSAAIAARQHGLDCQVLEQGVLCNSIFRFPPQMVFFTTPELLEIGGLPFASPHEKPTRAEALNYYRKVVDACDLPIAFEETVVSIERETSGAAEASAPAGGEPRVFAVETRSSKGVRHVRHARNVIMAIGFYDHPVLIGVPGEDLPHVRHYFGEAHAHYRQRIVVVGGGNSAAEAALDLFRAGARVTLVHRGAAPKSTVKYWIRPDLRNRIREGSVAARFNASVVEIRPASVVVKSTGPGEGQEPEPGADRAWVGPGGAGLGRGRAAAAEFSPSEEEIPADVVYLLTGYRADADLMRRAGVALNDRQAPTLNPETFETNVPGLFVAGGAIAGADTGTIFIENGRFHGKKIVEAIGARR